VPIKTHIEPACGTDTGLVASERLHAVRDFPDDRIRGKCFWVCPVLCTQDSCANSVDSGFCVAERGGATLSAWSFRKALTDPPHTSPCRRCSVGDGGRLALHGTGLGDRRDLGRSACAGFYRHKTVGDPVRSQQDTLLAGAPWCHPRSECCKEPLANFLLAISGTSSRSQSPRRSALAGGAVSVAASPSRDMGGNL
jgi:hypothetical protein